MNERELFIAALQLDDDAQRAVYLDGECAGDVQLRERVEALMKAFGQAGSFLQQPAADPYVTIAQSVTEAPGTQIGPYKLLQQIGQGGMGTVYMAEQSAPVQRRVALKVIKAGMDSGQVIARFEAERQALALMDHPNIAKVLDAGTTATGRPYFVMELVKGVPITTYCDENHLQPNARLELFTLVCQAVQHAHQKGVIHRDLKPTNVLVTLYDDKPVPKVIDFGVAKATGGRLTERTMFTAYGQVVGTLEYMSPEQARLNALDVDTRGDVYSLGVLLYELLTGTTPFDKKRLREAAFDEVLRMIREDEPPLPSTRLSTTAERALIAGNRGMEPKKLSGLVRGELDWIVMKALEKDRNRRYETANDLAADVQRYLVDEPVQACPPSAWYRCRKFVRRNKVRLLPVALLALIGGILVAWGLVEGRRSQLTAAKKAEEALTVSQNAQAIAEERANAAVTASQKDKLIAEGNAKAAYEALLSGIHFARSATHVAGTRAAGWSQEAWKRVTDARQFGADFRLRSEAAATLAQPDALWQKSFQTPPASSVAFSPDGQHVLVGGARKTDFFQARGAELYDSQTNERLLSSSPAGFGVVGFRGQNGVQLLQRKGPELVLWDVGADKAIQEFRFAVGPDMAETTSLMENYHGGAVLALGPEARLVAAAGLRKDGSGVIAIWDGATGEQQLNQAAKCSALAFSGNGRNLAVGNEQGEVTVWSVLDGKQITSFRPGRGTIRCLAFNSDDSRLAVGDSDGLLAIWDWQQPRLVANCRGSSYDVLAVAFSPDGVTLASGGRGIGFLWDVATGRPLLALHTRDYVTGMAFSSEGRRLACSSLGGFAEGGVYLWELENSRGIQTLSGLESQVIRVWFSADGKLMAALSQNWRLGVWDLASGRLLHVLDAPRGLSPDNAGLAFNRDGSQFAFSTSGKAQMWNLKTGEESNTWPLPVGLQDALAFDRNGELLLFRVETTDKRPFDAAPAIENPRVIRVRKLDPRKPESTVVWSRGFRGKWPVILVPRDAAFVVVREQNADNERNGTIRLFDANGEQLYTKPSQQDIEVRLDPGGQVLCISNPDTHYSKFYESRSGKEIWPPDQPEVEAVGGQGRWLIRNGGNNQSGVKNGISLFQRGRAKAILNLSLDQDGWDPRFSDDGKLLALGHPDGSVSVHDLSAIQKRLESVRLGW